MMTIEEQISEAFRAHAAGDFQNAGEQYAILVNQAPQHPTLLYLLGTLRYQLGDLVLAHDFLFRSIELDPANVKARMNFALVLQDEGRLEEALVQHDEAIACQPSIPESHNNRAAVLLALGRLEEARKSSTAALDLRPAYAEASNNLGLIQQRMNHSEAAEARFRQAVEANPEYAEAHANLGALLCQQKRYKDALAPLQEAVRLSPGLVNAHLNLGKALARMKRPKEAEAELDIALELEAKGVPNLEARIDFLGGEGRFAEAAASAFTLLSHYPNNAGALLRLASLFLDVGLLDKTRRLMEEAERIEPDSAFAHFFRGFLLQRQNNFEVALDEYDAALERDPGSAMTRWNRSLALLLKGRLREGFEDFEWRFHPDGPLGPHGHGEPQWDGAPLHGAGVLIHGEQGFGDILQFMRYVKPVQDRGGHVFFDSGQAVYKLLVGDEDETEGENSATVPSVSAEQNSGPGPSYDFQVPLLSLPKVFGTTVDSVPWDGAYVSAPEKRVAKWREKFSAIHSIKVGIVWAGNSKHKNDHNRSCRLSEFLSLGKIPGVRWFALQKGNPVAQAASVAADFDLSVLDGELEDFLDTAAIIANLDLVISVDTSVVHLAGAMAAPVWTLLPFNPDWRWMTERQDTPWYPSMRLFRQKSHGDWTGLFREVEDALLDFVEQRIDHLGEVERICLAAYRAAKRNHVDLALGHYRDLLQWQTSLPAAVFRHSAVFASAHRVESEIGPMFEARPEMEAKTQAARAKVGSGDRAGALTILRALQDCEPASLEVSLLLGECYFDDGQFAASVDVFEKAVKKWPSAGDLHFHLGRGLQRLDRTEEAMQAYAKAVDIDPGHPRAANNLAVLHIGEQNFHEANALLQPLVLADSKNALAWANLGRVWSRLEQDDLAEIFLRRALVLSPGSAFVYIELGSVLFSQGKMEEAIEEFNTAIRLSPAHAGAWASLGSAYWHLGRLEDAKNASLRALSFDSQNVLAHSILSWCYLPLGDYKRGWAEREWHNRGLPQKYQRKSGLLRWDGGALGDRRLLVYTEQGYGDALQFLRFLALVEGQNVTLECQDDLVPIVTRCPHVRNVVSWSEFDRTGSSAYDLEVPLMSLPHIFQVEESGLAMERPYLSADHRSVEAWAAPLEHADDKMKVGIVWAGNPKHKNDRNRSCKLEDFAVLAALPDVQLYCLQKGIPAEQALQPPSGMALINLGPKLRDFLDTAAVIGHLDVVITVDTAVAHLAGALGRPVWTLLPSVPDWRWMLDRDDSPWYPTMRLFRQRTAGDWSEVMHRVAEALKVAVNAKTIAIEDGK